MLTLEDVIDEAIKKEVATVAINGDVVNAARAVAAALRAAGYVQEWRPIETLDPLDKSQKLKFTPEGPAGTEATYWMPILAAPHWSDNFKKYNTKRANKEQDDADD
jgi:hypothetical protein